MNDATNTDTALNAAALDLRVAMFGLVHEMLGARDDRVARRVDDAAAACRAFDAARAGRTTTVVRDDVETVAYWGRIAARELAAGRGPRTAAWQQVAACAARIGQDAAGNGAAVTVRSIAGAILAA